MSITNQEEFLGISKIGHLVGYTLDEMRKSIREGMSTKELDEIGSTILRQNGARSAPKLAYGFPGTTCISINNEVAHGIPSEAKFIRYGDLINIDVSAELDGYFADNGASFLFGDADEKLKRLLECSKNALRKAIGIAKAGVRISEVGRAIESEAKKNGFTAIRNLVGHGVGRSLHESPQEIPCYFDRFNYGRFKRNSVVAIESFVSTKAREAINKGDGWTLVTPDGSYVAQFEHTIMITDEEPIILTESNRIWEE